MVTKEQIRDFSKHLAAEFRPQKIVLFGSHAYGTPREDSDVDLLVISEYRGNSFDRATRMLDRVSAPFAVDLLIRTPADTARRYREFDPLIREALDQGKVLYECNRSRMGAQSRRGLQHRPTLLPRLQAGVAV